MPVVMMTLGPCLGPQCFDSRVFIRMLAHVYDAVGSTMRLGGGAANAAYAIPIVMMPMGLCLGLAFIVLLP